MRALVDYIKDVLTKQEDSELQQAEILVNQEYANCLLEMSETV